MADSSRVESSPGRWSIPIALFLGSLILIAATLKDYGVTWDEPAYFHASDLHIQWLIEFGQNLTRLDLGKSLHDEDIKKAWHWDAYHVPHPPFSRIVSGITKAIFGPYIDKIAAYRLGPALFFALLVSFMYFWMAELFDRVTGLFSALSLIVIPNLFGFAHIAVTDMPLASMWFVSVYCFSRGLDNWRWSIVLGLVWGLALATKFPALLLPVPLLLWAHLYLRADYRNNLFSMIFLAPLVAVASQPYMWHQPALRFLEFLYEGISRGYRPETNFSIFFLNKIYYTATLPWYYPFFIVGVTTPEAILALALLGGVMIPWIRLQRDTMVLFLINAVFIICLGLLPGAVLHDGIREMLSALPFVAALAGGGFYLLYHCLSSMSGRGNALQGLQHLKAKIAGATFALMLFPPLLDLWLCHPFELSYYNHLIGGIRGAYTRGLETTYFMEALTPHFLRSLNEKLPPASVINASFANSIFAYYQKEGRLRQDIKITDARPFNYYILLNRRSILSPREQLLVNGPVRPYLSVSIAGVPLVSVFEFKKPA
jgi:dolichyl-phosphate-mannose-protein mannosyltransferase